MKAAVIREFGGVGVLKIEDLETPQPRPGHLLIKILAAAINRFEHHVREGSVTGELPFPHILGADAAGEVAEIGEGVRAFEVGERVVPMPGYLLDEKDDHIYPDCAAPGSIVTGLQKPGTCAQFLEVPALWVLKDRTGLPPEQVATLPMVATTSVRAVKVVGEVNEGDSVLIQAGASSVGAFQIQVAKALGARVAATVRNPAKAEALRDLGADLVIDASQDAVVDRVKEWTGGVGADVAIDNIGGTMLAQSIEAVRPQGIVVAIGFLGGTEVRFDIRNFFFQQKQLRGSLAGDIRDLEWALEQVREGALKPVPDKTLTLGSVSEAHRLLSTNQLIGNILLLPWTA